VIVARVRRTLRDRALIEPGMRVLAACSGGPDSGAMLMALARLSTELEFTLEAASVDHGLRADAAADVAIASEQAAAAGVAFHALRVTVAHEGSLQAGARAARYAALQTHARAIGAKRIAVGHTQDDQAETVLLRVLRGAGLAGLSGIEPLRADGVMRPLIDCRRADVHAFATQHCPRVARDASNEVRQFSRVRVRQDLLPLLEREDGAAIQHLSDLADDARATALALLRAAETLLGASVQGDGSIDVSTWFTEPSAVRRAALRSWVARIAAIDVGRGQLIELERAARAPAEIWLSAGWVARSAGEGRISLSRDPATSTA
jgi:tRNA(Ile)-lysidine synthase